MFIFAEIPSNKCPLASSQTILQSVQAQRILWQTVSLTIFQLDSYMGSSVSVGLKDKIPSLIQG